MTFVNDLIDSLREELQQYGEMLARLDDAAANNHLDIAEDAPLWAKPLQEQEGLIEVALCRREQTNRRLARHLRLPEETGLPDIIPLLPRHYQLLVTALMDENKAVSARVQQRANQKCQLPRPLFYPTESHSVAA
jgi:hypothetical protein